MSGLSPRLLLLMFLILTAAWTQAVHPGMLSPLHSQTASSPLNLADPILHNIAFNLTLAQFDLYTNRTAVVPPVVGPPGTLAWFNSTIDGRQVNGTRFVYEIPAGQATSQNVTWTVFVPKGNYTGSAISPTFLRFRWNGTIGSETSARYLLLDGTSLVRQVAHTANFTSGQSPGSLPCFSDEECFDVSSFIGKSLNLVFKFNSNSTGAGLKVQVSHVVVASVSPQDTNPQSAMHAMIFDTADPSKVNHNANSTVAAYNTTALQPLSVVHTWNSTSMIIRFPASYTLTGTSLNGTTPMDLSRTVDSGTCSPRCNNRLPIGNSTVANTRFISFNLTSSYNALKLNVPVTMEAFGSNAVAEVETALTGASTNFWVPGDTVGVRMKSQPGFNSSGSQIITLTDPDTFTPVNQTFSNKGGQYLYNVTLPLTATLGPWEVGGVFLSGYDYGFKTHSIRVEQLKTTTLTVAGTAGQDGSLAIRGTLAYMSNSTTTAAGVNATVFAVDAGSPPGLVHSTGTLSAGLYVSTIEVRNGLFTANQPLTLFFTVTNPTPSTAFSANLTIEHEWYLGSGGSHGATITLPLQFNDEPFLSSSFVYRIDATLTPSGIHLVVKSLTTTVSKTLDIATGSSGISASRQHFGNFRISVTSKCGTLAPLCESANTSSLRSPAYAYVLHPPLVPSRLLDFSQTVPTLTNGTFSTSILGERLLGAKRLTVFVLARDANGIVLGMDEISTITDSSSLTPTADVPGEVTVNQNVTVTFSLKSNSTSFPIKLTVNLDLSEQGTVRTTIITIQPGATQPTPFSFRSPAGAGSYLLTFSSPQYGVLLTKTLQVSLVQSSLQILIPAIIGLVVALVILGVYLVRRRPETELDEKEKPRGTPGRPSKPQQSSSTSKSLTRS